MVLWYFHLDNDMVSSAMRYNGKAISRDVTTFIALRMYKCNCVLYSPFVNARKYPLNPIFTMDNNVIELLICCSLRGLV